jgi:hypothetical protein
MTYASWVAASIFLLVLTVPTGTAAQQPACDRPSPALTISDPVFIGAPLLDERRDAKLNAIRDWIWQHWHERNPGRRFVTIISVDGRKSVSRITIEPDCAGAWSMNYHINRYSGDKVEDQNEFDAYTVDRIKAPASRLGWEAAADKEMKRSEYRLVFRDKDLKALREF